jgi:hypothetical protein
VIATQIMQGLFMFRAPIQKFGLDDGRFVKTPALSCQRHVFHPGRSHRSSSIRMFHGNIAFR